MEANIRVRRSIFIFTCFMMALFSATNTYFAEQQLPKNYGAKGALLAQEVTVEEALVYALQDEYLAQARYDAVIDKFGEVRPFMKIKESEKHHIHSLLPLFKMFKTKVPEDDAKKYVTAPETLKEAYQDGVEAEIENIDMYERFLEIKDLPEEARAVFQKLSDASRKHLEALNKGLSRV
ncbi:DUF2202 domain-containing protein [Bacillus shivajii]|uniref:ferritin-like domain-containing protein n=1 Tax=Bacillus shivajii TaxID=1983719 RepID=UPI001CFAA19A|nr:DUF2202 domain-containing protein [Bacillus shivajii]UCZ53883.1 DUF2202 domain-containing protein [Bacillus shivajii]